MGKVKCKTSLRVQRKVEKIVPACRYTPEKNSNTNEVHPAVKRAEMSTERTPPRMPDSAFEMMQRREHIHLSHTDTLPRFV